MIRTVTTVLAATCLALPASTQGEGVQHRGKHHAKRQVKQHVEKTEGHTSDRSRRNIESHAGRSHTAQSWKRFQEQHPEAANRIKDKADRDGNGKIDVQERRHALKMLRKHRGEQQSEVGESDNSEAVELHKGQGEHRAERREEKRSEVREHLDRNEDGRVGPRERHHAHHKVRKEVRQGVRKQARSEVREHVDHNGDGKVGPRERHHARHEVRKHARSEVRDRVDRNDDGRIGTLERRKARQQTRSRVGQTNGRKVGTREHKGTGDSQQHRIGTKPARKVRHAARPPR